MSKPAIGAVVQYCGHKATFIADIFEIEGVNVVRANFTPKRDLPSAFDEKLNRDPVAYLKATHHLDDWPLQGFWRPGLGVFVVPKKQVKELRK
jgi:hypothetical protein